MKYYVGCSGYYYPGWKNIFYPPGLPNKSWLNYYSSVFNSVELNGTFYHTPRLSSLIKYARETPDDFKFSVKMSRYITHVLRMKDCRHLITDFQNLIVEGLADKLIYFLFQMPPSFHYNEENLQRLINNIPNKTQNVIEFRHLSWWNNTVKKAFTDARLTFCNIDFPGLKTGFLHTSSEFYLRLHGNPELFKSSYSKQQLKKFHNKFPLNCKQHTIYFNNTYYDAGLKNALQLMEILKST